MINQEFKSIKEFRSLCLQYIFFISSLCFFYSGTWPSQNLIYYSPAFFISAIGLFYLCIAIKDFLFIFALLLLWAILIFANVNINSEIVFKALFSIGAIASLKFIKLSSKYAFFPLLLFFLLELYLRLSHSTVENFSLYSLKGTFFLFFDANYVGVFLASAICGLLMSYDRREDKWKLSALFLLLFLTFSRTSWIVVGIFVLIKKYSKYSSLIVLSAFLLPFLIEIFSFDVFPIDGSFKTKQLIFHTFFSQLQSNPSSLLFGFLPGDLYLLSWRSQNLDSSYMGHTIFGQILQYGFLQLALYAATLTYISRYFIKSISPFVRSLFVAGFLGFFPLSFLGSCFLLYEIFQRKFNFKPLPLKTIFSEKI